MKLLSHFRIMTAIPFHGLQSKRWRGMAQMSKIGDSPASLSSWMTLVHLWNSFEGRRRSVMPGISQVFGTIDGMPSFRALMSYHRLQETQKLVLMFTDSAYRCWPLSRALRAHSITANFHSRQQNYRRFAVERVHMNSFVTVSLMVKTCLSVR